MIFVRVATALHSISKGPAAEPDQHGAARPLLLYILSPSYSGSTLLTYLLAQHPRIATIGELKATGMGDVSRYACSCGELITRCAFWARVTEQCRRRGVEFSVDAFGTSLRSPNGVTDVLLRTRVRGRWFERARALLLDTLPRCRAEITALVRRNFELSRVICELQDRDVFLDGSKDAPRLLHFARSGLWRVRTIFLTRDGRGVVNSLKTRKNLSVDRAAEDWVTTIRENLSTVRLLDPREVITVRYEELCANPDGTLARVWDWLGIGHPPLGQDFRAGDFHILGNEMRLRRSAEIKLDERWRRELDADALQRFERRAGALNRALGYS